MKLFVTGATGFLGRHFCRYAMERGHEILALMRPRPGRDDAGGNIRVASGSLEQFPWDAVERFQPDAALHLAWLATPGIYLTSPQNQRIAEQSAELFAGLAKLGVGHLVGLGTCLEYAPSDEPLQEYDSPIEPCFPYSRSKVTASLALEKVAGAAGIESAWLRLFYPFGTGEHSDRLPSYLMTRLSAGTGVELKTPASIKDYVHISDVSTALMTVLEQRAGGIFNIGSGEGIAIRELAEIIAEVVGVPADLVTASDPPATDPFPVTVADTSLLRSLGWDATTSLRSGLRSLWISGFAGEAGN